MKRVLLALALLGGLIAPALAQVQDNLSGNETWSAGQGAGGPGAYITSGMVRGGSQTGLVAISGNHTIGSTSGSAPIVEGGSLLITGTPATANITMPPNPVTNGAVIAICNATTSNFVNTLTVVANTGQTLVGTAALAALVANTCVRWQFQRSNTTWYRVT